MAKFEIPTEAARPLYAGVGATDLVVGYVRDAVADFQKRIAEVQKDVQTRITHFEFEPKSLREQAVTAVNAQIDAFSKDAKTRREAIEARVVELQDDLKEFQVRLQEFLTENAERVPTTYADLAKRGETLVERIRNQQSTKEVVSSAKTTTAKAKTTTTQAKKAVKSTTKKATSTAKKASTAPKRSAKATVTAAKATAADAVQAATDAAEKVGD